MAHHRARLNQSVAARQAGLQPLGQLNVEGTASRHIQRAADLELVILVVVLTAQLQRQALVGGDGLLAFDANHTRGIAAPKSARSVCTCRIDDAQAVACCHHHIAQAAHSLGHGQRRAAHSDQVHRLIGGQIHAALVGTHQAFDGQHRGVGHVVHAQRKVSTLHRTNFCACRNRQPIALHRECNVTAIGAEQAQTSADAAHRQAADVGQTHTAGRHGRHGRRVEVQRIDGQAAPGHTATGQHVFTHRFAGADPGAAAAQIGVVRGVGIRHRAGTRGQAQQAAACAHAAQRHTGTSVQRDALAGQAGASGLRDAAAHAVHVQCACGGDCAVGALRQLATGGQVQAAGTADATRQSQVAACIDAGHGIGAAGRQSGQRHSALGTDQHLAHACGRQAGRAQHQGVAHSTDGRAGHQRHTARLQVGKTGLRHTQNAAAGRAQRRQAVHAQALQRQVATQFTQVSRTAHLATQAGGAALQVDAQGRTGRAHIAVQGVQSQLLGKHLRRAAARDVGG